MAEAELTARDLDEALARALGYEYVDAPVQLNEVGVLGKLWRTDDGKWRLDGVPIFHRNLNDMHAVEMGIHKRGLSKFYIEWLANRIGITPQIMQNNSAAALWTIATATAEQRAHAALAVLRSAKEQ